MSRFRMSVWAGCHRQDRIARRLRGAGIRVESEDCDGVVVVETAATPREACENVRIALLRRYKTHFGFAPVVIETFDDAAD